MTRYCRVPSAFAPRAASRSMAPPSYGSRWWPFKPAHMCARTRSCAAGGRVRAASASSDGLLRWLVALELCG